MSINLRGRQSLPEVARQRHAERPAQRAVQSAHLDLGKSLRRCQRKNGMSLPNSADNAANSDRDHPSFQHAVGGHIAVAASLDAPPSPAAEGMRLIRCMAAPAVTPAASRNRSTARTIKLFPSAGTSPIRLASSAHRDLVSTYTGGYTTRQSYSILNRGRKNNRVEYRYGHHERFQLVVTVITPT